MDDNTQRELGLFLEDQIPRVEAEPVNALKYRAADLYDQFNDRFTPQQSLDVYSYMLNGNRSEDSTSSNITSYGTSPIYGQRLIQSAPTRGYRLEQRLESYNPAKVEMLKQVLFPSVYSGGARTSSPSIFGTLTGEVTSGSRETAAATTEAARVTNSNTIQNSLTGFFSRPGVRFYTKLLGGSKIEGVQEKTVSAIFFQFQNTDIVSSLLGSDNKATIASQALDLDAMTVNPDPEKESSDRIRILAGNELFHQATSLQNKPGQSSLSVNYGSSFHPKIGYTSFKSADQSTTIAFIGTQNITTATSRNSTIESVLSLNVNSSNTFERSVAQEVVSYTNATLSLIKKYKGQFGDWDSRRVTAGIMGEADRTSFSHLVLSENIASEWSRVLKNAESTNDKVILSFGEFRDLGDSITGSAIRNSLLNLAGVSGSSRSTSPSRLQVIVDSSSYHRIMQSTKQEDQDTKVLLQTLSNAGAITLSPTGFHHDKTIAIVDQSGSKLKYLSIGSANMTKSSLSLNSEYAGNVEVIARFGTGEYKPEGVGDGSSYLDLLYKEGGQLQQHYRGLAGGQILANNMLLSGRISALTPGYLVDRPSALAVVEKRRISQIKDLHTAINTLTQTGSDKSGKYGMIKASYRYSPVLRSQYSSNIDTYEPIGLRVEIKGPDRQHSLSIDLSVTDEGNVVVADLNKVLSGAFVTNKSSQTLTIFGKASSSGLITRKDLAPGQPGVKLNSFETTLAFVETVQRAFVFQQEYGLVDITFRRLVSQDRAGVHKLAQELVSEQFAELFPRYRVSQPDKEGIRHPVNLRTIVNDIQALSQSDPSTANKMIDLVLDKFSGPQGSSLTASTSHSRRSELEPVLTLLRPNPIIPLNKTEQSNLHNFIADQLVEMLLYQDEAGFNDFKKQLVMRHELGRAQYKSAANTQSRTLLSELLSGFLGVHQETYNYFQGQDRLPLFGITNTFFNYQGDSQLEQIMLAGILDPLPVGHHTLVGPAGALFRGLTSTAHGSSLLLPALGGLKELTVSDSGLKASAATAQDMESMLRTTPGFNSIGVPQIIESARRLLELRGKEEEYSNQLLTALQPLFKDRQFISIPYESYEQIPQRVKNVVGQRPALNLSNKFMRQLFNVIGAKKTDKLYQDYGLIKRGGGTAESLATAYSSGTVLAGRMRRILPSALYEEVGQFVADYKASNEGRSPTWGEIESHFRQALLKPGNVHHGFIGEAKYKRIALSLGPSMLGDYNYLNPAYQYDSNKRAIYGKQHITRVKFNPQDVESVTATLDYLGTKLAKGAVALSQYVETEDGRVLTPGLYSLTDKGIGEQIGVYTDDGFIQFTGIHKQLSTGQGQQASKFLTKTPAFTKRTESGITYIPPTPQVNLTTRGMYVIELESVTAYVPSSTSRWTGAGSAKGPVMYLNKEVFSSLETEFGKRAYSATAGLDIQNDSLYGLASLSTFKGFNTETGMYLLTQNDFRNQLRNASGLDIARAMSFMFLDDTTKKALGKNLINSGQSVLGLAIQGMKKGTDLSKANFQDKYSVASFVLAGLTGFSPNPEDIGSSLEGVKELVLKALAEPDTDEATDGSARLALKTRLGQLLSLSENKAFLDEGDPINRGMGLLAHLFFYSSQLITPSSSTRAAAKSPNVFISGLYEVPLDNYDLYYGRTKEVKGFTSESYRMYVDMVLRTMGYKVSESEEEMRTNMNLAQQRLSQNVVLQHIIDNSISQSLVAAGKSDTINMEFQFYIGMTKGKLDAFRPLLGAASEDAKTIQEAYSVATAVMNESMLSLTRERSLGLSILIPDKENQAFITTDQLDLIRMATSYSYQAQQKEDATDSPWSYALKSILGQDTYSTNRDASLSLLHQLSAIPFDHGGKLDTRPLNPDERYLQGLKTLESQLKVIIAEGANSAETEQAKLLLNKITTSQLIVLPTITTQLDTDPNSSSYGRYYATMSSVSSSAPTTGVLLGTDFLSRMALSFGDFKSSIITEQLLLVNTLIEAQGVLSKFNLPANKDKGITEAITLDEAELDILRRLREVVANTSATISMLPTTDVARQAFGDHEALRGVVGIAVNSFLLNPDEVLLGERYMRIAGGDTIKDGQVPLSNLIHALVSQGINAPTRADVPEQLGRLVSIFQVEDWYNAGSGLSKEEQFINLKQRRTQRYQSLLTGYDSFLKAEDSTAVKHTGVSNFLKGLEIAKVHNKLQRGEISIDDARSAYQSIATTTYEIDKLSLSQREYIARLSLEAYVIGDILNFGEEDQPYITAELLLNKYQINDSTTRDDILNKSAVKVVGEQKNILHRLASLAAGVMIARTGEPATTGGMGTESNLYKPLHFLQLQHRARALAKEGDQVKYFEPDERYMSNAMVVPSISNLISGLGDYDGDSYRLISQSLYSNIDEITTGARSFNTAFYKESDKLKSLNYMLEQSKYSEGAYAGVAVDKDKETDEALKKRGLKGGVHPQMGKRLENIFTALSTQPATLTDKELLSSQHRFTTKGTILSVKEKITAYNAKGELVEVGQYSKFPVTSASKDSLVLSIYGERQLEYSDRAKLFNVLKNIKVSDTKKATTAYRTIMSALSLVFPQEVMQEFTKTMTFSKGKKILTHTPKQEWGFTDKAKSSTMDIAIHELTNIILNDEGWDANKLQEYLKGENYNSKIEQDKDGKWQITSISEIYYTNYHRVLNKDAVNAFDTFRRVERNQNLFKTIRELITDSNSTFFRTVFVIQELLNSPEASKNPNIQQIAQTRLDELESFTAKRKIKLLGKAVSLLGSSSSLSNVTIEQVSTVISSLDKDSATYDANIKALTALSKYITSQGSDSADLTNIPRLYETSKRRPIYRLLQHLDKGLNGINLTNIITPADLAQLDSINTKAWEYQLKLSESKIKGVSPFHVAATQIQPPTGNLLLELSTLSTISDVATQLGLELPEWMKDTSRAKVVSSAKVTELFKSLVTSYSNFTGDKESVGWQLHSTLKSVFDISEAVYGPPAAASESEYQYLVKLQSALEKTPSNIKATRAQGRYFQLQIEEQLGEGLKQSILDAQPILQKLQSFLGLGFDTALENANAAEIKRIKDEIDAQTKVINNLVSVGPELYEPLENAALNLQTSERRALDSVRRFIINYSNLPYYATEQVGTLGKVSTGQLISNLRQKFDLGNIKDASDYTELHLAYEDMISTLNRDKKGLSDNQALDIASRLNLVTKSERAKMARTIEESISKEEIDNYIKSWRSSQPDKVTQQQIDAAREEYIAERVKNDLDSTINEELLARYKTLESQIISAAGVGLDDSNFYTKGMEVATQIVNLSQAVDTISKKVPGRAAGSFLSPEELTSTLSIIGEGGTSLIGIAYNTLIPLMDTLLMEQPFKYNMSEGLMTRLVAYRDAAKGNDEEYDQRTKFIDSLGIVVDDTTGKITQNRERQAHFRQRFEGTISILANFQQIVRDALKAKEGGRLEDTFDITYRADASTILEVLTGQAEATDQDRKKTLTKVLFSVIGTEIDSPQFRISTPNIFDPAASAQATGFGALLLLADYTRTGSDESLYEKFIKGDEYASLQGEFERWVNSQGYKGDEGRKASVLAGEDHNQVKLFLSETIINLMQRTQASFSVSSQGLAATKEQVQRYDTMMREIDTEIRSNLTTGEDITKADINVKTKAVQTVLGFDGDLSDLSAEQNAAIRATLATWDSTYTMWDQIQRAGGIENLPDSQIQTVGRSLILNEIQRRDKEARTLTPDTIEYLKMSALDIQMYSSEWNPEMSPVDRLRVGSIIAYGQLIRSVARGRVPDVSMAMEASQFRFHTMLDVISKSGIDITQIDSADAKSGGKIDLNRVTAAERQQIEVMGLMVGLAQATALGTDADSDRIIANQLITFLGTKSSSGGRTGLEDMAQTSAALATYETLLSQRRKFQNEGNQYLVDEIDAHLRNIGATADFSSLNMDRLQTLGEDTSINESVLQTAQERVERIVSSSTEAARTKKAKVIQGRLQAMKAGDNIGLVLTPLLIALANSDNFKLDERVGLLALDIFQGAVITSEQTSSTVSQFITKGSIRRSGVMTKRVRTSALQADNVAAGLARGAAFELVYRGVGGISQSIVQHTIGAVARRSPNLATVGGAASAELLSSVLAMGITRLVAGAIAPTKTPGVEVQFAETLSYMANSLWQAVYDIQESLEGQDVVAIGSKDNQEIEILTSALPHPLEENVLTGIASVLSDKNGHEIHEIEGGNINLDFAYGPFESAQAAAIS